MTDNEIIKALEEWIKGLKDDYKRLQLLGAPMDCYEDTHIDAIRNLSNALDLINRQQAENETLTARIGIYETCNARKDEAIHNLESEIERLQNILLRFMDDVAKWEEKHGLDVSELPLIPICDERRSIIDHHRAEAIKEFAERLKENKIDIDVSFGYGREVYTEAVAVIEIDNLVQEMVGDNSAE